MIRKSYIPRRGDLVWIDFDPQSGHEQSGLCPAVVLSPQSYNEKVGLALICPVTSKAKGYPWEVGLPDGLQISGVILADLVKSLDWRSRSAEKIGSLPLSVVTEVLKKLGTLLDEPSRA